MDIISVIISFISFVLFVVVLLFTRQGQELKENIEYRIETLVGKNRKYFNLRAEYLRKEKEKRLQQRKQENCLNRDGSFIPPPLVLIETARCIPPEVHNTIKNQHLEERHKFEKPQESVTRHPILLEELITSNYPRIVIVADSGMGKTTLLKELMLSIANNEIETSLTPVYLHFSKLCKVSSVHEAIKNNVFYGLTKDPYVVDKYIEKAFANGQFLFFIDGLDQLPPGNNPKSLLEEGGDFGMNRVIFTSRPYAYGEITIYLPTFKLVQIEPFNDQKVQDFLGDFYNNEIIKQIQDANRLLLQIPIFLAYIRELLNKGQLQDHTVQTTSDIYELIIDKLLDHAIFTFGNYFTDPIWDKLIIGKMLSRLSYVTLKECYQGQFPVELKPKLVNKMKDFGITNTIEFDRLTKLGVFSQVLDESDIYSYVFRHQSFQEYLASKELKDRLFNNGILDKEVLLEHLEYGSWDEVWCFLVGSLKTEEPTQTLTNTIAEYDLSLAVRCLSNFRGNKNNLKEIIHKLLDRISAPDWYVRNPAAEALVQLDIKDNWVIETLLYKLRHRDWYVRLSSAKTLWKLGIRDKRIIAALLAELNSSEMFPRGPAAETVSTLGIKEEPVIQALLSALNDREWLPRIWSAKALWKLGIKDNRIKQVLLDALRNGDWFVRHPAAEALGQLEVNDDWIIRTLIEGLNCEDWYMRNPSAEALIKLGVKKDWAKKALLESLRKGKWFVRISTAEVLVKLGINKDEAIEVLLAELRSDNWYTRRPAADALRQLNIKEDKIIEALLVTLTDKDEYTRVSSAMALGELGVYDDRAVGALLTALEDNQAKVRAAVATALGHLGKKEDPIVDALLAMLVDKQPEVQSSVITALGQLGIKEGRVIAALLSMLKNDQEQVCASAANALSQIAGVMEKTRDKKVEGLLRQIKEGIKTEKDKRINNNFVFALEKMKVAMGRRFLCS